MSAKELLSVVDEADRVIDTRSRGEIHAEGLRHRAVHILVFNSLRQVFMQKRTLSKDINPGLWDTAAAGHVDAGELYDDCAVREIQEELGFEPRTPPEFLFKLQAAPNTGMEFVHVYKIRHNGPFELNPDEIETGDWFAESEISKRVGCDDPLLTETFKVLWRQLEAVNQTL
ncbi:MAG: NUDIX hydrolase [Gammaproteobacteria bacterium]